MQDSSLHWESRRRIRDIKGDEAFVELVFRGTGVFASKAAGRVGKRGLYRILCRDGHVRELSRYPNTVILQEIRAVVLEAIRY